jgi:ABC-type transport system involved in cytochrome c biogenesis permease subunit
MGIMTGSVWAHYAWGSYWSWDPKEIWSLITWLIYAIMLHARHVRGWRGKRMAIMAITGFVSVLFTYLGVNFLPSLHSYL